MRRDGIRAFLAAVLPACLAAGVALAAQAGDPGINPSPIKLVRPPDAPLSAMALLGRDIFYDPKLSASGQQSCASCHDPSNHYGPPNDLPAMLGGPGMNLQGARSVPSLEYLERQLPFSIGPEQGEVETAPPIPPPSANPGQRATKTATDTATTASNMVPQGGLFWDGRVDTLQQQAMGPLLNPVEMANKDTASVAAKLRRAPYAARFKELFGAAILRDPSLLANEAMFAVARYQIEDPSFHPYNSKFDYWLEGRASLTPSELRGYRVFNDPDKANCGGCHLDTPGRDGTPPRFTDTQYEALGVPRNPELAQNRDPGFFDLGVCGPFRSDIRQQTQYCGMFLTPSLRNVATRHAFFHNGVYHDLRAVLDFYNNRDVAPDKVYPPGALFDDIPPRFRANIDVTDPPFNRHKGDAPAMTLEDEADIIAFLQTLTDGFLPSAK